VRVPPHPLAHRYEGEEWNWVMPCSFTCGHRGVIERGSCAALDHVVEYAETTPCWDCWIAHKEKHGKVIR
jgi:hypothetical protein